jgi:hypothetical protein
MSHNTYNRFAWYLAITPNQMFSLYEYPVSGKNGLPLCEEHGRQIELKEVVVFDQEATKASLPNHCWVSRKKNERFERWRHRHASGLPAYYIPDGRYPVFQDVPTYRGYKGYSSRCGL